MRYQLITLLTCALLVPTLYAAEQGAPERVVRAFHTRDFEDSMVTPPTDGSFNNNSRWIWQPMFDGLSQSSVLLTLNGPSLFAGANASQVDLTVDEMHLTAPTFAVVGRWAAANFSDDLKESVTKCTLQLVAEYQGLPPQTTAVSLSQIGNSSTPVSIVSDCR